MSFDTISEMSYGELLSALRKDLQLDAKTDILAGSILEAVFAGGNVQDAKFSTVVVTFTAADQTPAVAVPHRLVDRNSQGIVPKFIFLQDSGASGSGAALYFTAFNANTTTFQAQGQASTAITTGRTLYWIAIG